MAKYVYRNGRMVNKETGEPMVSGSWEPSVPQIMPDIAGYRSPIDGKWVEGRRARRYDLESNNCVDANDISKPKKLKNRAFIEKHGLQHLSEQ